MQPNGARVRGCRTMEHVFGVVHNPHSDHFNRRPGETHQRSNQENRYCTNTAITAAGTAPCRIRLMLDSLIPVRIGAPYPPAPINAPMVAVPTLITAAVLIPANIEGIARGSSINFNRALLGNPMTSADSRVGVGICVRPAYVFLTIGNKL